MSKPVKSLPLAVFVLAGGMALMGLPGCGGDDLPRRYPVSGKVTYRGQPVPSGTITFTPADLQKGRSGGGMITGGNYVLTSLTTEDGAIPGRYKVTVISRKESLNTADTNLRLMYEKARSTGGVPIPPQVKKQLKTEDLVPAKYAQPETSDLTAEVKEQSNVLNFELKD